MGVVGTLDRTIFQAPRNPSETVRACISPGIARCRLASHVWTMAERLGMTFAHCV